MFLVQGSPWLVVPSFPGRNDERFGDLRFIDRHWRISHVHWKLRSISFCAILPFGGSIGSALGGWSWSWSSWSSSWPWVVVVGSGDDEGSGSGSDSVLAIDKRNRRERHRIGRIVIRF